MVLPLFFGNTELLLQLGFYSVKRQPAVCLTACRSHASNACHSCVNRMSEIQNFLVKLFVGGDLVLFVRYFVKRKAGCLVCLKFSVSYWACNAIFFRQNQGRECSSLGNLPSLPPHPRKKEKKKKNGFIFDSRQLKL